MNLRDELRFALRPLARIVGAVPVPSIESWRLGLGFYLPEENYDFQHAFRLIPTLQFCVDLYQTVVAAVPLKFYTGVGDNKTEVERQTGNIVDLWHGANVEQTGYELVEDLVGSLQLQGNAYLFKDYLGTSRVRQLWVLNPVDTRPVPGPNRTVLHYEVRDGARLIIVPREQVVHFRRYDPDMKVLGVSPVGALRLAYETQRDAARWLRGFYKRGGTVAGHYSTEFPMEDEDFEVLRKQLRTRYQGPENAWDPVILPKRLKWERAGLTLAEMQFVESQKMTDDQMLRLYKVPKMLAGITDGSGLNSDVASVSQLMFLRFGVMPLCTRIAATLNEKLLGSGEFGPNVTCEFDFSNDPVMVEAFLNQAKAWNAVTGGPHVSRAEARDKQGLPERDDVPGLDDILEPIGMTPAGEGREATEEVEEEAEQELAAALLRRVMAKLNGDGNAPPAHARDTRAEDRDHARRRKDRLLLQHERRLKGGVVRIFEAQRARVKRELNSQMRALDVDKLVDRLDDPQDKKRVRALLRAIVRDAGEQALADLGLDLAFALNARDVREFIERKAAKMVTNINSTTRDRLRDTLAEGVGNNESLADLVARVDRVFDGRRGNSMTIARTETGGAYNYAEQKAWKQSGVVETKVWLTARDEAVRPEHAAVDGDEVELGEPFIVDGEEMDYPGDMSAPLGLTANCRCTMVPGRIVKGGEDALPRAIRERMALTREARGSSLSFEEFMANGHDRT